MTPRKKWPQVCEDARVDSISAALKAMRLLTECINVIDNLIVVRKLNEVKDELHKIETKLKECKP